MEQQSHFRLVDLTVLIAVIGILLMLLLPSVNHHGPSKRSECLNNQKSLALALMCYESQHRSFPGYVDRLDNTEEAAGDVSWVVTILSCIDRPDLHDQWKQGNRVAPSLPFAVCPSDPGPSSLRPRLSYVANCGLPGDEDTLATGVFHNHNLESNPVLVSTNDIAQHDGLSNTLLLSENLQAGYWNDTEEANIGMVWFREPKPHGRINQGKDIGPRPQNIEYARPASNHTGVFNAAFCDGHVAVIHDQIDYNVYRHLMTPDSKQAGVEGKYANEY